MKNKIKLRPLKYNLKPTLISQILKCEEEETEFKKAILKADVTNAVEEFYDDIQAKLGALRMLGVPLEVIIEGQEKHFDKLKSRGWKFEEDDD